MRPAERNLKKSVVFAEFRIAHFSSKKIWHALLGSWLVRAKSAIELCGGGEGDEAT